MNKMGWRYQARKKRYSDEVLFEVVEAYPNLMGSIDTIVPHTINAVTINGSSKEDLVKWLRIAADDIEKYDVIEESDEKTMNLMYGKRDITMNNGMTEEQRLRLSLERILLDMKFMHEDDIIPYVFNDFIYQTALELMTPEFMKEFNNDKDV